MPPVSGIRYERSVSHLGSSLSGHVGAERGRLRSWRDCCTPDRPGLALHRKHWREELRRVPRRIRDHPDHRGESGVHAGRRDARAHTRGGGRGTDVRAGPARRGRTPRRAQRGRALRRVRRRGRRLPDLRRRRTRGLRRVLPRRHRRDLLLRGGARQGHPQRGRLHREGQAAQRAQPAPAPPPQSRSCCSSRAAARNCTPPSRPRSPKRANRSRRTSTRPAAPTRSGRSAATPARP